MITVEDTAVLVADRKCEQCEGKGFVLLDALQPLLGVTLRLTCDCVATVPLAELAKMILWPEGNPRV